MNIFQINALIQFLASSKCTCLEPHGLIIRITVCTVHIDLYGMHENGWCYLSVSKRMVQKKKHNVWHEYYHI